MVIDFSKEKMKKLKQNEKSNEFSEDQLQLIENLFDMKANDYL